MSENFDVKVESNVEAVMRDGTVLRADVYRPSVSGNYPVLLCRTPYDKLNSSKTGSSLAEQGYISVVQDLRGRFASDGEFSLGRLAGLDSPEAEDGYDSVEWAAELPESDGQVGVWGHSYPGWCFWQLAPTKPPHLKASFPSGMGARVLDQTRGIFETGRRLHWMYQQGADARRRKGIPYGPHTRAEADASWYEVERGKWIWFLPLAELPDSVFSDLASDLKQYMITQDQETWDFDKVHHKIEVPTCQVTGWYDRLIGTIDNYTGMVEKGPSELRNQHRLIVGPWPHSTSEYVRQQGPIDFGPEADAQYADLLLRWFDFKLKGSNNGLRDEPPVRLFIMGANTWRNESEWPVARTSYTDYFLHSESSANTIYGDGSLSDIAPQEEEPDTYVYDPRDPVMSLLGADVQDSPRDPAPLDGREDVLVYQTPPLEADVEVTGPISVVLWVSSDVPDTDFAAKLVDVHPDGSAIQLCYGILRCRYREGYGVKAPDLNAEKSYELNFKLNPTSNLFMVGHRIRLDVSSSNFPLFDRNHNTGKDFSSDTELRVAHLTVYHDTGRPSRLILPVIPA